MKSAHPQPSRVAACSCGQLQAHVVGEPVRVSVCHCWRVSAALEASSVLKRGFRARRSQWLERAPSTFARETKGRKHVQVLPEVRRSTCCVGMWVPAA